MTPVFAVYELGDALLTVLAVFFIVVWIWVLITILIDLFRDHELSGWWKAVWVLFLVVLPLITAIVYLIARGDGMRQRAIREQQDVRQATDEYIRSVATSSTANPPSRVDELRKLADLRQEGAISEAEYERLKTQVVG